MFGEKAPLADAGLPPPAAAQPVPAPARSSRPHRALLLLALFVGWQAFLGPAIRSATNDEINVSSSSSSGGGKAGDQTKWAPCEGFESNARFSCATQEVPLDHAKGLSGGAAIIALSKYSVPDDKRKQKLGTLFVNPGGPGGSGQAYTFRAAPALSHVLEDRYDILGFDPRGINETLPRMACFEKLRAERDFLKSLSPSLDSLDVGTETYVARVREKDLENQLIAERCELEAGAAGRHMGTTTVVRDIEYLSSLIEGKDAPINFGGWSYGTVMGQYLVSMFPDRVGRVMIDGVCDILNWVEKPHDQWGRSDFLDSEKTFSAFLTSCAAAGPSRCALAHANSTHDSLLAAVDETLEALNKRPMIIRDWEGKGLGLLRGADVKGWIFGKLYRPAGWGDAAKDLDALLNGNGSAIYQSGVLPASTPADAEGSTAYANPAVECSDAAPYPDNLDDDAIVKLVAEENAYQVKHISRHFAAAGVSFCPRWGKMRETERYAGPWNKTLAHPMLIIGNEADPITSGRHAELAHKIQPHSALIHHEGFGHCSTAQPSLCTALAIRNYFVHGKLPEDGLKCKPDGILFPELVLQEAGAFAANDVLSALSVNERNLLQAMGSVGDALHDGFRRTDGSWGV